MPEEQHNTESVAERRPPDWRYCLLYLADVRDVDDLEIDDDVKWTWIRMIADARVHDGKIRKENLRKRLKITPKTCEKRLEIFLNFGLILDCGDHYAPRFWEAEQSAPKSERPSVSTNKAKSSTERSREFRARHQATRDATATRNATDIDKDKGRGSINLEIDVGAPLDRNAPARRHCRPANGSSLLAEDALPTNADKNAASSFGLSENEAADEWQAFRAHHIAKGSTKASWHHAWVYWLTQMRKGAFEPRGKSGGREDTFVTVARKMLTEYQERDFIDVAATASADNDPMSVLDLPPLNPTPIYATELYGWP